jgi:hypothetical protein
MSNFLAGLRPGSRECLLSAFYLAASLLTTTPCTLSAEDQTSSESISIVALESITLPAPRVFTYERTERDPFVDASVKQTLISQADPVEPAPEQLILGQIAQEVDAEIKKNFKITGLVCGERDGVVLIGRRILRAGDRLDLILGEDLLNKMRTLDQAQHMGWGDVLSLGILPLEIVWVEPTGIGLSHGLQQDPFILPFPKNASPQFVAQPAATPK